MDADTPWWTDMNRRRIFIDVVSSGSPSRTSSTCIKMDLFVNQDQKIIWYTNSKMKAEDSLVPSAENAMDKLGIDGEAMLCTGGSSLLLKRHLSWHLSVGMKIFSRDHNGRS